MTAVTVVPEDRAPRYAALAEIAERHGGTLTPAAVVDAARAPDHPLHAAFVWDDTEAAERYRLLQAAALIRAVVTVVPRAEREPVRVRAFVSLTPDRVVGGGPYRRIHDVIADPTMSEVAVQDALAELRALRAKYAHLSRLAGVWAAVDAA